MLIRRNNISKHQIFCASLDLLVPEDHILRLIEKYFDWNFIYDLTEEMYSKNFGRPAVDPVMLIKILLLQYIENLGSIRNTIRQIQTNFAYRWFLGLGIDEKVPDHSTLSKAYSLRFEGSDIFNQIFERILEVCFKNNLLDTNDIYVDSTHVKAHANPHRYVSAYVKKEDAGFEEELEASINKDRQEHGKKALKPKKEKEPEYSDKDKGCIEMSYDEAREPKIKVVKKKRIKKKQLYIVLDGKLSEIEKVHIDLNDYELKKVSKTDCQSGWFHKGEHKHVFAYTAQTACESNNYILAYACHPGNVHDSRSFFSILDRIDFWMPNTVTLDAGYKTPAIARALINRAIIPVMPYKRPVTKKGFFRKYEYAYDETYDCYICPQGEVLSYKTTTRDGYREYISNPGVCSICPHLEKCTLSQDHRKVLTRHVWYEYLEEVEEIRYSTGFKDHYKLRQEKIERVYADCKENMGLRFIRYVGIKKMEMVAALTFSSSNLIKMATHLHRREQKDLQILERAVLCARSNKDLKRISEEKMSQNEEL